MKILSLIVLVLSIILILALTYYLLVGKILFKMSLARKTLKKRVKTKNLDQKLQDQKLQVCFWDKYSFEDVSIESFDHLKLKGKYFNNSSNKTVFLVHGFSQSYLEMANYCSFFMQKNFNVLTVDCRAHNTSEGNCIGFGWLDRKDILIWLEFLNKRNPSQKILLFGLSMGATAVCCACGEKLPHNVVGAIVDSAFSSADKQFDFLLKKYWIFGKIAKIHLFSFARRVYGLNLKEINVVNQVKNTKIPILYIHGGKDSYVPIENMYALYNSTPSTLRDQFVVESAQHASAYAQAGVLYEKKISDFIKSRTTLF